MTTPVGHEGRRLHVTPPPATVGSPYMLIAGGSEAAARRAARHGLGFISQVASPDLKEIYDPHAVHTVTSPASFNFLSRARRPSRSSPTTSTPPEPNSAPTCCMTP